MFYYKGLKEWKQEKEYLIDMCLAAQDQFKVYLDYFRILFLTLHMDNFGDKIFRMKLQKIQKSRRRLGAHSN